MEVGKAAVFTGAGKPFEIRRFDLRSPREGEILVKVKMSTICGSDLHTWQGKRQAKLPTILGHEIMGTVAELGAGVEKDYVGNRLKVGDRITWTVMAACGHCYFCQIKSLPQKCVSLFKYGHESCSLPPHFNGGLAEYIYLVPGTGIFKVPDELSNEEVVPINCALTTVVNGVETIRIELGDNVVVQGAGMLGINAVAVAKERGANQVICLDISEDRLKMAEVFGADSTIDLKSKEPGAVVELVRELTGGWGADVAIEVCGVPRAIEQGIEMLRTGGRYLIVGAVFPDANFSLDVYSVITKNLTLKGIHNYQAHHLRQALEFVTRSRRRLPFSKLVTNTFGLEDAVEAFKVLQTHQAIRAAVVPDIEAEVLRL